MTSGVEPARHHEMYVDLTARVVTIVRNAEPFATVEQLRREAAFFEDAVRGLDRGRFGLVVDARVGPGRHDESLEEAFAAFRRRVMAGFRAVAVVTTSAAGKLHASRYARVDGANDLGVFDTLQDARDHVAARSERRVRVGVALGVEAKARSRGASR